MERIAQGRWGGDGLLLGGAPETRGVAGPVMPGAGGSLGGGTRQRVHQGREGEVRRRVGQFAIGNI